MLGVVNFCIEAAVNFQDILHRFRAGWWTGTASLGAKLFQYITAIVVKSYTRSSLNSKRSMLPWTGSVARRSW